MTRIKPLVGALAAAGVLAGASAGAFGFKLPWNKDDAAAQQPPAVVTAQATPAAAAVAPAAPVAPTSAPNFRAIVQQAGPAVVGVTVEGTRKTSAEEDPMAQFFRGFPGFQQRGGPRGGEVPFRGAGSGFIVSSDGLVLTNAHVVEGAKEVTVKLQDRREYRAKVLGSDKATDVAVLRLEAKGLPTVRLGDPKQLQVGDPVLAIGSPYGFEQTATQGIVSAKGRSLPGDAFVPFIQTDAAVNPGNSGGPLFDGAGNVVGINAQIYSQTGGYQGLAFAIPIDVALKVKDQIVATGSAQHARLGVVIQDLSAPLAESFGLPRPDGALVAQVAPGSPAAAAGLKAGDVITQVNGEAIERSGTLSSRIGLSSPGDKVKLQVWRDKAAREVEVKLARAEDPERQVANAQGEVEPGKLGLALRPLSPQERQQSGLQEGLVVEQAAGPAARAGVSSGDVLLAINGQPVQSVEQLQGVLKNKPRSVALLIERQGERIFVPVQLG
ncbi:Do family serine endopeptidase [Aquincola tertiaricarbonis]|uniref:Do family serine endopeptidase n=1 Tax=Aquincola tertiaricarbonis TaxID=391953 RepID=UPI000614A196|nr:Do family serine endopeptidase [Aquincola tertiaricarbonis]